MSANPLRWPDGSYSVQGAAAALGITPQTVFDYLARGGSRVDSSPKGSPGKSSSRMLRSSRFGLACDTPDDPERRHHDSVEDAKMTTALLDRLTRSLPHPGDRKRQLQVQGELRRRQNQKEETSSDLTKPPLGQT